LSLLLLSLELWTFGSDVTGDAVVMTGGQASFVGMLLDFLCRNMVSILTNNIALPQSILLNPRPVGFLQITIWPNMANLPTIMTLRNKLTLYS
jgi:hypothetical protein